MAAVQAHGRSVRDDWLRTRRRQQRAGQSARPGGAVGTRRPREPHVDSESPTRAAGAGGKWGAEGWLHAGATTGRLEWPRHHTGPLGRSGRPFQPPRNTRGLSSPRHRRRRGVTNVRGKCLGRVQGDRSTGLSISQGDGYHHWSFMASSQGD